jgi:hypothetical protein
MRVKMKVGVEEWIRTKRMMGREGPPVWDGG